MSADSPRRNARGVPAIVPPQVVSDRSIIDSVAGFINDVTLAHQPQCDPKDTITWARFETTADISDSRFGDDWELEGNVAPPLLLILGFGQGVQVWAIPANGEAVEVLSWRHGIVSALRVLPTPTYAGNGRADEPIDAYSDKRPLMAICDGTTPAGSNPQFCAVNFVSLKTGGQVKTIKFKNPVLDILANRSSIVITFHERIAVFDARSLEDRLSVTTCFPSPGINPNPVALGSRWMAYSENKLLHSKRSGGGCDGDGVASYTATVLNAAKSFGKGLRELGEQVAAGLTGTSGSGLSSKSSSFDSATGDVRQPGVVTILDIKHPIKDVSPTSGTPVSINGSDPIVAHFIAHSEAVVAMEFDNSGMMLLTADRRGHDFHLFRIQPHPVGSSLAAVHHLYVLHRGDTSAKVQNITFSLDSRWVAVSTLRGTTHVFPVTPYGGPAGVRTHTSLHVVNKLSRFHRSAGLTADGRSSSPISHSDSTNFCQMLMPYHNPTLPPFPRPTVVLALAQLRQPCALGSPPGSAAPSSYSKASNTRQRLSSLSDDNGKPLSVCAVFAKSRSWLLDPPNAAREAPHKIQRKAVDSLFVMAGHGALIQYDLDTKLATNVAKEKICDDTPIELEVEAKAQWNLGRKDGSLEIMPPLSSDNWLVKDRNSCMLIDSTRQFDDSDDRCDSWLSQVEIITHAGPHRRLWMGPQFVFKTYNTPSGSNLSHIDVEAVEIGVSPGPSTTGRPERSSPLNMPLSATGRSTVPVLIESGSYSSIEQSPKLMDRFRHEHMNSDFSVAHGDTRLKEDLADAMRESPSVSHKDTGGHPQRCRPSTAGSSRATASSSPSSSPKARSGVSGGVSSTSSSSSSSGTLTAAGGGGVAGSSTSTATSNLNCSQYESLECLVQQEQQQQQMKTVSIEKVVNPLGTVTTITGSCDSGLDSDDVIKGIGAQDCVIHENCDESLFRPVVAIFCDEASRLEAERLQEDDEYTKPPEAISNTLIVPVIEKAVDIELTKKESMKNRSRRQIHVVEDVKEESNDDVVSWKAKKKQVKEKTTSVQASRDEDVESAKRESVKGRARKQIPLVEDVKEESNEDVVMVNIPDVGAWKPKKKQVKEETTTVQASRDEEPEPKLTSRKSSTKAPHDEEPAVSLSFKVKSTKEEPPKKKQVDKDLRSKPSSGRKVVESDEESVVERPRDEKATTVEKKPPENESKPSKLRKSVDVVASSPEVSVIECLLDEAAKPVSSRKSSITEAKPAKKEEEPKRKTSKGRKSEERDVDAVAKHTPGKFQAEEPGKSLKITKTTPKVKEHQEPEPVKLVKPPISSDDFEDEKPIEFKRMTALPTVTASTTKSSNKGAKSVEKSTPAKVDAKSTASEKKVKLEKGSSVESAESVDVKSSGSSGTAGGKEKGKVTDQLDGKDQPLPTATKKKAKAESKKKPSDDVKTTTETSLAVELSNASVLADSLLDFLSDKPEEESLSPDVDKLKKKTGDTEPVPDLEKDQKSKLKPVNHPAAADKSSESADKKEAISPAPAPASAAAVTEKETKKSLKKSKASAPSESTAEVAKIEDLAPKVTVNKKDAIITVEEKTAEESKNLLEMSVNLSDTKAKSKAKLKAEKPVAETPKNSSLSTEDSIKCEKPLPEPKSSQLIEIVSPEPSAAPVEKKVKKDKLTRLLEVTPKSVKAEVLSEGDKSNEMTGSKITIEPIKVDTFLNDLMDSQKATKSKSSPTESLKSEESPKKSIGSPLKFVDTYVESCSAPGTPSKKEKEKAKKKPTPGKAEKLLDKPEPSNQQKSPDRIQFFDKFLQDTSKPPVEQATPWKSLAKTDEKTKPLDIDYPTLGKPTKTKKSQSPPAEKKKHCIAVTVDLSDGANQKGKNSILDDLPSLQPLDDLPMDFLAPLPPLEPLEGADENISLINFESPLQEASKPIKSEPEPVEKSSQQFPKGFPSDTIIFALCGSLHYENENSAKPVDSPLTLSFSDSTAHTTAEYKSLTENDDQYLSLEQSSQENPPSTSSSTCEDVTEAAYSSGGGGADKSAIASAKLKNKQRRKKQLITAAPDDDEELRPLISKSDDANLMTCSSLTVSKPKPSVSDKASAGIINKKETLPSLDNNQVNSDSSSSDQATTSEDPDDQICLNVHADDTASAAASTGNKSAEDGGPDLNASSSVVQSPQKVSQSSQQQQQQQPNSSKKKLKRRKNQVNQHHTSEGGTQSIDHIDGGDLSSSSLSTGSRASLDPPSSSPTMSITGDNLMHFPADSSGSL